MTIAMISVPCTAGVFPSSCSDVPDAPLLLGSEPGWDGGCSSLLEAADPSGNGALVGSDERTNAVAVSRRMRRIQGS